MTTLFRKTLSLFAIAALVVTTAGSLLSFPHVAHAATTANLAATAPGNYGEWTLGAGSTKVSAMATNDGDTSYIRDLTNAKRESFVFQNAGIPADAAVNSVTLYVLAKEESSGGHIKLLAENGTGPGHQWTGSSENLPGSYGSVHWTMSNNPSTGAAWTTDEVNAWTTRFGVQQDDSDDAARVTQMYVVVDYTSSAANIVIDSINNQSPGGHCIAGQLSIVVHGTRGANGGPYSVEAGNGTSTSSPVSVGSGANGSFGPVTINFTPTGSGTNLYVVLFHGSDSGNDSHSVLVNQCIPPPTKGVLTVVKNVASGNALASAFQMHVKLSGNDVVGSPSAGSSTGTDYQLLPGTYSVSEDPTANYSQTNLVCHNDTDNTSAAHPLVLVAGKNYTCTVTNSFTPPTTATLNVIKHVVNDNGGSAVAGAWTLTVSSSNGGTGTGSAAGVESPGTAYTLQPGKAYSVSESGGPSGYTESDSADCNIVSATAGSTYTCTITNDDIAPTIKVFKTVVTDNGGSAVATNFSFLLDSVTSLVHNLAVSTTVGAHTLSENAYTGYTASSWGGDCAANGSITLTPGQNATCTITNDDQPGTLIVKKVVVGGPAVGYDHFSFQVDNGTATPFEVDGQNDLTVNAGTYHVSEVADSAYSTGYANCDPVVVANGQTQTCTITNTFRTGNIIVVKNTVGPDGAGTSFAFTTNYGNFNLNGGGSNNDSGSLAPGQYSVSETPTSGWDLTSASCSNGDDPSAITLNADETVTCTFTNTERGHIIVDKVTDPAEDPQSFDFTVTGTGYQNFSLTDTATPNDQVLVPGTYSVSEGVVAGWNSNGGVCDNDETPGNITLSAGEVVHCTFTNTEPPTLQIVKNTIGGDGSFDFFVTQSETDVASTTLQTVNGTASSVVYTLAEGGYDVTEDVPTGWTLGNGGHPVCLYNGNSIGNGITNGEHIVVDNGDLVVCTFTDTNNNPPTDLAVVKSVDTESADVGDTITYTITVTNNGPADAHDVVISDLLPSGVSYQSDDGEGSYATSTGEWTIGTLENESSVTLHITATVNEGTEGDLIINTAAVSSANPDTNGGNNAESASVTVNTPQPVHGQCNDGIDNEGDTLIDQQDPQCSPNGVYDPRASEGTLGGGSGIGGGIIGGGGGGGVGSVLGVSTVGQVLGASCGVYMDRFVRIGKKNNVEQVKKLQEFLNKQGATLPVTGFFGPLSLAAVMQFQQKYANDILKPWGITSPTGIVYQTTLWQINKLECPELTAAFPTLVEWSKNNDPAKPE